MTKWKDSKIVNFIHFSNKRRFEQIYETSLWNETMRQIGVLRNFTKLSWKHLCLSFFFNKVAGLRPRTLLKRDSNTDVFRWILWNLLRTPFFTEPLWRLFLYKRFIFVDFCSKKSVTQIFSNLLVWLVQKLVFYMTK